MPETNIVGSNSSFVLNMILGDLTEILFRAVFHQTHKRASLVPVRFILELVSVLPGFQRPQKDAPQRIAGLQDLWLTFSLPHIPINMNRKYSRCVCGYNFIEVLAVHAVQRRPVNDPNESR